MTMKKTIILTIACMCLAVGAYAQRGSGRLSLGAGLLYKNGLDVTLAYEHEMNYRHAWEFFAHNLSGCFHLSRKSSLCTDKLIKWKTRNLYNYIIKHWLETCVGLLCDCILDLIQIISKSDLCRNFGDRVSCCLRSKCGRTAYTR